MGALRLRVLQAWQQPHLRLGVAVVLLCATLLCGGGCYANNATMLAEDKIIGPLNMQRNRPVRVNM